MTTSHSFAASDGVRRADIERTVRIAGRALSRSGLAHAYGHCSARLDDKSFVVSPARPLGLIRPGERCVVVRLDGELPEGVLGEVRIHREIYRRRHDVNGVVRCTPAKVMSLSTLGRSPRARHGLGSYFFPEPPLWSDPQLLRSDERAGELADRLGRACAIVMRGNGAVTVGESLRQAVVLAWYLEDAARVELDCLHAQDSGAYLLSENEATTRATWSGRILERMWEFMTAGDAETNEDMIEEGKNAQTE